MKKKYYKYALWTVLGTSLLSVLFSLIYFLAAESLDEGTTGIIILYYVKLVLDLLASFVGFATIIYTFTKYGWLDGLKAFGIYLCSVVPYFIFQSIVFAIDSSNTSEVGSMYVDSVSNLIMFSIYYTLGQLIIALVLPAVILMLLCRKYIKDTSENPISDKFVSFKTPTQKTMGVFCIVMAVINILSFLLFTVLPYLIQEEFYITYTDFKSIMLQSLFSLLENGIIYIVVQYIVFMLAFRFYDACLKEAKGTVVNNKK